MRLLPEADIALPMLSLNVELLIMILAALSNFTALPIKEGSEPRFDMGPDSVKEQLIRIVSNCGDTTDVRKLSGVL